MRGGPYMTPALWKKREKKDSKVENWTPNFTAWKFMGVLFSTTAFTAWKFMGVPISTNLYPVEIYGCPILSFEFAMAIIGTPLLVQ